MCNFIKANGEQCKLAPKKDLCHKHKNIETNIEQMPPQQSQSEDTKLYTAIETMDQKFEIHEDLFETIFEIEKGAPRVDNLKETNELFYETFDHNKLAFILNNIDAI